MTDKKNTTTILIIVFVLIIIGSVVIFLLWKYNKLFVKQQQSKKHSLKEGYGYYSDPQYLDCKSLNGKCNSYASRKIIKHCIPNPITQKGCIDSDGNMTYHTLVTEEQCKLPCVGSAFTEHRAVQGTHQSGSSGGAPLGGFIPSGSGCNNIIDHNTGIHYTDYFLEEYDTETATYKLKQCVNEQFVGYKINTYSCDPNDEVSGTNKCQVTCGFESTLNVNAIFGKKLSKNVLNFFPSEYDEDGVVRHVCYDINDVNQVEILNNVVDVPTDFVLPSQCYEHFNKKSKINFNNYYPIGTSSTSSALNYNYSENQEYFIVEGIEKKDLNQIIDVDSYKSIYQNYETYIRGNVNGESVLVDNIKYPSKNLIKNEKSLDNYIGTFYFPPPVLGDFFNFNYQTGNNDTHKTVYFNYSIDGVDINIPNTFYKYNSVKFGEKNLFNMETSTNFMFNQKNDSDGRIDYQASAISANYNYTLNSNGNHRRGFVIDCTIDVNKTLAKELGINLTSKTPDNQNKTINHFYYLTKKDFENASGFAVQIKNIITERTTAGVLTQIEILPKDENFLRTDNPDVFMWFFRTNVQSSTNISNPPVFFSSMHCTGNLIIKEDITLRGTNIINTVNISDYSGVSGYFYGTLISDIYNPLLGFYYPITLNQSGTGKIKFRELSENWRMGSQALDTEKITFDNVSSADNIFSTLGPTDTTLVNFNEIFGTAEILISYGTCQGAPYGFNFTTPGFDYTTTSVKDNYVFYNSSYIDLEIDNVISIPRLKFEKVKEDESIISVIRNNNNKLILNRDNYSITDQNNKIRLYYQMLENSTLSNIENNSNYNITIKPEKSIILKADYDIFRSPYIVNDDGTKNKICYNKYLQPLPKGTVISLELNDKVQTNIPCSDYNSGVSPGCGTWKTAENFRCIQERITNRPLFDESCVPYESDEKYSAFGGFMENGIDTYSNLETSDNQLFCYDEFGEKMDSYRCNKLLYTTEYDSVKDAETLYPIDQEVYLKNDKKDYFYSLADDNNNDPLNPLFWRRIFNYQEGSDVKQGQTYFIKIPGEDNIYVYECTSSGTAPYNINNSTTEFNYKKSETFYTKYSDLGIKVFSDTYTKGKNSYGISSYWNGFERPEIENPSLDLDDYRTLFSLTNTESKNLHTPKLTTNFPQGGGLAPPIFFTKGLTGFDTSIKENNFSANDGYAGYDKFRWVENDFLNCVYATTAASKFPYEEYKGFMSNPYDIGISSSYDNNELTFDFSLPDTVELKKGDFYNPSFGFWNKVIQGIAAGPSFFTHNSAGGEYKTSQVGSDFSRKFFRGISHVDTVGATLNENDLSFKSVPFVNGEGTSLYFDLDDDDGSSDKIKVGDYLFYVPVFGPLNYIKEKLAESGGQRLDKLTTPDEFASVENNIRLPFNSGIDGIAERVRASLRILQTGAWYGVETDKFTIKGKTDDTSKTFNPLWGNYPTDNFKTNPALLESPVSLLQSYDGFNNKNAFEFEIIKILSTEKLDKKGPKGTLVVNVQRNIINTPFDNLITGSYLKNINADYFPLIGEKLWETFLGKYPNNNVNSGSNNPLLTNNFLVNNGLSLCLFYFPKEFINTNFQILEVKDNKPTFKVVAKNIDSGFDIQTDNIKSFNYIINNTPYYQQPYIEKLIYNDPPTISTSGSNTFHIYNPGDSNPQLFNTITDILYAGKTSNNTTSIFDYNDGKDIDNVFFFKEYKVQGDKLSFNIGDKISISISNISYEFEIIEENPVVSYTGDLVSKYPKTILHPNKFSGIDFKFNKKFDYKCTHTYSDTEIKQFLTDFMTAYGSTTTNVKYCSWYNQVVVDDDDATLGDFNPGWSTTSRYIFQPRYIYIDESNYYDKFEDLGAMNWDTRNYQKASYGTYGAASRLLLWQAVIDLTDLNVNGDFTISNLNKTISSSPTKSQISILGPLNFSFANKYTLSDDKINANVSTETSQQMTINNITGVVYKILRQNIQNPRFSLMGSFLDSPASNLYAAKDIQGLYNGFYHDKTIKWTGLEPYDKFPKLSVDFFKTSDNKFLFKWANGIPDHTDTDYNNDEAKSSGWINPDEYYYNYRAFEFLNSIYNRTNALPFSYLTTFYTKDLNGDSFKGTNDWKFQNLVETKFNDPNNISTILFPHNDNQAMNGNYLPTGYQYNEGVTGDIDKLFYNQYELDKGNWATFRLSETSFFEGANTKITAKITQSRGKPSGPGVIKHLPSEGNIFDKKGYGTITQFSITSTDTAHSKGVYRAKSGFELAVLNEDIATFNFLFSIPNFKGFETFDIKEYNKQDVIEYTNLNNRRYYRNLNNNAKFDRGEWLEIPKTIYQENTDLVDYDTSSIYNKGDMVVIQDQLFKADKLTLGSDLTNFTVVESKNTLGSNKNNFYSVYNQGVSLTVSELENYKLTNSENLPLSYQGISAIPICPMPCNKNKLPDFSPLIDALSAGIDASFFDSVYAISYDGVSSSFWSLSNVPIPTSTKNPSVEFLQSTPVNASSELYSQYVYNIPKPLNIINSDFSCEGTCFGGIDNKVTSNALINMVVPLDLKGQDLQEYKMLESSIMEAVSDDRVPRNIITFDIVDSDHNVTETSISKNGTSMFNQNFVYDIENPGLFASIVDINDSSSIFTISINDSDISYHSIPPPNSDLYKNVKKTGGDFSSNTKPLQEYSLTPYDPILNGGTSYKLGDNWYGMSSGNITSHGFLDPLVDGSLNYDSFIIVKYPDSAKTDNISIISEEGKGVDIDFKPYVNAYITEGGESPPTLVSGSLVETKIISKIDFDSENIPEGIYNCVDLLTENGKSYSKPSSTDPAKKYTDYPFFTLDLKNSSSKALNTNQAVLGTPISGDNPSSGEVFYFNPVKDSIKVKIYSLFGSTFLSKLMYTTDRKFPTDNSGQLPGLIFSPFTNDVFATEKQRNISILDSTFSDGVCTTANYSDVFSLSKTNNKYSLETNPHLIPTKSKKSSKIQMPTNLSIMTSNSTKLLQGTKTTNLDFVPIESTATLINDILSSTTTKRKAVIFNELRQNTLSTYLNPHNNCSLYFKSSDLRSYTVEANFKTTIVPSGGNLKYNFIDDITKKEAVLTNLLPNVYYILDQTDKSNKDRPILFKDGSTIVTNNGPLDPYIPAGGNSKIFITYYINGSPVNLEVWKNPAFNIIRNVGGTATESLPIEVNSKHILIGNINDQALDEVATNIPVSLTISNNSTEEISNTTIQFRTTFL